MFLARIMRRRSSASMSLTSSLSLSSLASSHIFYLSPLYSLRIRRGSAVGNALYPVMGPIILLLTHGKLRYLSLAVVTVYCRPRIDLFTSIVVKFPIVGKEIYPRPTIHSDISQR